MIDDGIAFRLGHRRSLDGVRAIAIIAVLGVHFNLSSHAHWLTRGGLMGVDLFFVLSGFLITSILVEEAADNGRIRLSGFYARRALRLFPALLLMVAGTLLIAELSDAAPHGTRLSFHDLGYEAFAVATYWDNWFQAFHVGPPTPLSHAWSLAIEEQFYLVWPITLILALRWRGLRGAFWVAAIGAVVSSVARVVEWHGPGSFARVSFQTHTRASDVLVGCALSLALYLGLAQRSRRLLRVLLVPAVVVCAVLLADSDPGAAFTYRYGIAIFSLAAAVVMANLVLWRVPLLSPVLESAVLGYIGLISYGLYLWLRPVQWFVLAHSSVRVTVLAGLPLVFALATMSFYLVERPFLRLKKRFSPRRPAAAKPAAAPASG